MKICMIGGTGLLGSQGAAELISRGHEVRAIALPPLPQGAVLPPEMEISYGNYLEMNDNEIKKMFEGCEGFVFAAGVDERVEGPAPIYDLYKKYNIDVLCKGKATNAPYRISSVYPFPYRPRKGCHEFCG